MTIVVLESSRLDSSLWRRVFLAFAACVLALVAVACAGDEVSAVSAPDAEIVADIGYVSPGAQGEVVLEFPAWIGEAAVDVPPPRTSCGCVDIVDYTRRVQPGERVRVVCAYDTSSSSGMAVRSSVYVSYGERGRMYRGEVVGRLTVPAFLERAVVVTHAAAKSGRFKARVRLWGDHRGVSEMGRGDLLGVEGVDEASVVWRLDGSRDEYADVKLDGVLAGSEGVGTVRLEIIIGDAGTEGASRHVWEVWVVREDALRLSPKAIFLSPDWSGREVLVSVLSEGSDSADSAVVSWEGCGGVEVQALAEERAIRLAFGDTVAAEPPGKVGRVIVEHGAGDLVHLPVFRLE